MFDLPVISTVNTPKIHEFSEKLMFAVQSLETMKKLEQVNGYVAMTLDKLPAIRGDLIRTDPEWQLFIANGNSTTTSRIKDSRFLNL